MQVSITYRGMQSSPTISSYVQEKVKKIERILSHERPPITLEVILESHPVRAQRQVETRLHCAEHHIRVQTEGTDLYAQIDKTFDKLLEEVRHQKEKQIDARKETK